MLDDAGWACVSASKSFKNYSLKRLDRNTPDLRLIPKKQMEKPFLSSPRNGYFLLKTVLNLLKGKVANNSRRNVFPIKGELLF